MRRLRGSSEVGERRLFEMSVSDHIKALGLCLCLARLYFTHSTLVIIFCHPDLHQSDGDTVHYKTKISTNTSIWSFSVREQKSMWWEQEIIRRRIAGGGKLGIKAISCAENNKRREKKRLMARVRESDWVSKSKWQEKPSTIAHPLI